MSDIRYNGWLHRSGTGGVWQDSSGNVGIGSSVPSNAAVSANTKVLNVGIVTAAYYYGSGANLTGITGTTINNNADNRLITGSGTANTLEGEANLTYNGTQLVQVTDAHGEGIKLAPSNDTYAALVLDANRTGADTYMGSIEAKWNGSLVSFISFETGTDTTNKDDGLIAFSTRESGQSIAERLRITPDGKCLIPDNGRFSAGAGEDLYLYSDGTNGIIRAPNSNLYLQSDTAVILSDIGGNETFLKCTDDAGVEIYHNNKVVAKTDQYGLIVGDETTDQNAILIVKAAEARDAEIRYYSDQADDNADMWRGINAGNAMQYQTYATGSWEYRLLIGNGANGSIQCCATDQADITAGGISLGNANVGGKWYATGNTTASLFMFYNPANGNVGSIKTNGAATSFNTSSDYRLKENEVPLENAITKLKGLKPYTFNFKTSPSEKVDGFYAHEAAEVVPIAVTGTKDEMAPTYYKEGDTIPAGKYVGDWTGQYSGTEINPQGVDYSKFTPLLTKALQELVARVEALESA